VQSDRRLAGARTTLDDQNTVECGPDDVVLFGLNGLNDVAHPAGTACLHRGEQARLAGESGRLVRVLANAGQVEHFVVERGDCT
jgi:hypothetical protein